MKLHSLARHSVQLGYMNRVPDWLWQELAADAIWTSIAFSAAWALKNRRKIVAKLQYIPEPITIPMTAANLNAKAHKVTVSGVTDLRWRVEAPTLDLPRFGRHISVTQRPLLPV
jgi:hypothetical protein